MTISPRAVEYLAAERQAFSTRLKLGSRREHLLVAPAGPACVVVRLACRAEFFRALLVLFETWVEVVPFRWFDWYLRL